MMTRSWCVSAQSPPTNHMSNALLVAENRSWCDVVLLLWRDSLMMHLPRTSEGEVRSCFIGQAVWIRETFAFHVQLFLRASVPFAQALCRVGLVVVYWK